MGFIDVDLKGEVDTTYFCLDYKINKPLKKFECLPRLPGQRGLGESVKIKYK